MVTKGGANLKANTRFPVAIHILAFVTMKGSGTTSEAIAESVNTNPVVVRKLNARLKKAGLLTIYNGPAGGTELSRPPDQITLLDVFQAVRSDEDVLIFETPQHPNPECPIGGHVLEAIDGPFREAQQAMKNVLAQYTILDIVNSIKGKT